MTHLLKALHDESTPLEMRLLIAEYLLFRLAPERNAKPKLRSIAA